MCPAHSGRHTPMASNHAYNTDPHRPEVKDRTIGDRREGIRFPRAGPLSDPVSGSSPYKFRERAADYVASAAK